MYEIIFEIVALEKADKSREAAMGQLLRRKPINDVLSD